ncbi:MAG: endonuclease/exonuclease/phosphatase family protein [Woeseiaceae bacterium]
MTLRGLLQAAGILAIVFSVATLLPIEHFAVQLFTHFRLQYLGAALVLLVAFAALREPRYALAMVLVAVLNGSFVLPWYLDKPAAGEGTDFDVLLANILSDNDDHEKLLALIEGEQPDLVLLLEVSPRWQASLGRLDALYPHRIVEPRVGNFGIAMYSRHAISSSVMIDSAPLDLPTIVATLDIGGRAVQVVGTHPMIPLGEANYEARNTQLTAIAGLLQGGNGPKILVGDLNTTMWDSSYRSLENKTWLRSVRRGFGVLPSWPMFMPIAMIPIDHILVSDDIGVRDVRTGPRIGSDHLPLVATLVL